ncbi:dTDP-4-amino-4,6-dideoxygalactose transaminase [Algoriphagus boseongensis]|uniref:dTDP-4-amino-4,6-dideoxygalactose transaminase n=1 Tax=Algoriphagus boseongensis TaxID=1442587 RepID=A0A4R6T772_9BACT|nr:DegT/DnrJ/EryC1/StrS family aminotransferase [Algoriphagus boseongensis]TDQ16511.1 dTDP-4-amino-4,6-dideoxygalactose transaminase [Algoriphagus boseongensis]
MDSSLKERLKDRFEKVLEEGIFSGRLEVQNFENTVSKFLKSSYSISCANGTDALELALRALSIGLGDEVIVPALTWVSTAEAVVLVGAKPVFVDTDEQGLISEDWPNAMTPKTKAVIPVHLYGKMVDMEPLVQKASQSGIFVIEDAAQAFGAFQKGKAAGTWGDVGCLSFYPTKNLGALGEAGMCLTQNSALPEKIRLLLNHGQPVRDQHELVGRNSRIDSIQAAFLNVMLEDFEGNQTRRKAIAKYYLEEFSGISDLILPEGILAEDHNAHLFVVQTERRDELRRHLEKIGIGTAIHYPKILPEMKPFLTLEGDFSISERLSKKILSIPLNSHLNSDEVNTIIREIKSFFLP